jgi:acyl-CoA reductase-like NAD-dependent aldehyde dehydrogenase/nicotinamidase-related amidase
MSGPGSAALLLVDLQHDFLGRAGLVPDAASLCRAVATLLGGCRTRGVPVAHVHTQVRPDGTDRMPHWIAAGVRACVAGTPGAAPPDALAPLDGELVVHKQFYSGFSAPALDEWLRARGVRRVVVAGVYTHGCVQATVLDAYARGYEVCVVEDAVGTTDALHGLTAQTWLEDRAARFQPVGAVLRDLGAGPPAPAPAAAASHPVAVIAGRPRPATNHRRYAHRSPARPDAVAWEIPVGCAAEVDAAASAAADAQRGWGRATVAERAGLLDRWADVLTADAPRLAALVVDEVGKPAAAADDEVQRAVAHVRTAAALLEHFAGPRPLDSGVAVRQRPVGVVGLLMPWNNPVALPVGKLAPALAFGNAAILKPAPEASSSALALLESLDRAGAPPGVANVVLGDRETAEVVCDAPGVDAISVTGSVATGRAVAARCARATKPLQAELGGNNAAIVLADADLEAVVPALLRSAYAFAGQRCTAVRRFVVDRAVAARFEELASEAVNGIVVGDPNDRRTEVGPMISVAARDRVLGEIEHARDGGARLVTGGVVPPGLEDGAWLAPTLLADVDLASAIAREETFGPVAVLLPVADLDEALAVADGVEHGLILAVCTVDAGARARVLDEARVGIVQMGAGPLPVHPDAPFGGWKASGLGPPEHGEWDVAFYSRPQAVYGDVRW